MIQSTLPPILFGCAFILTWITLSRSECSRDALETVCPSLRQNYLDHYSTSEPVMVTIACSSTSHRGWSLSLDGGKQNPLLDTSLARYTVDGSRLTINNVSRSDDGLYQCVYDDGRVEDKKCFFVYGRAVFASCPQDFGQGCSGEPEGLSATAGGSLSFNATVIHTAGGNCGFLQDIRNVRLIKTDDLFSVPDQTLLSCSISPDNTITCSNGRVSLDRGRDPGYEFVFTLSDVNASDAGTYKVEVATVHPSTGNDVIITKQFSLVVPSTTPPTVNITTPALPVTTSAPTTAADSDITMDTKTTPNHEGLGGEGGSLALPIIAGFAVVLFIVVVVAASIIITVVIRHVPGWPRKSKGGIVDDLEEVVVCSNKQSRVTTDGDSKDIPLKQVVLPPPRWRPVSVVEPEENLPNLDNVDKQEVGHV